MKGLFIKDLQILGANRRFLVMYMIFVIGFSFFNPSFALLYLFILTSTITVKTISFDERDHGMLYLFSWPITKEEYVIEKFTLSIVLSLTLALIMAGLLLFFEQITYLDLFVNLLSGWITMSIILSIYIPVELKYGSERSSSVIVVIFAVLAAAIFVVATLPLEWNININEVFMLICAFVVTIIMLLFSGWLSLKILKKKEW